MPVVADVHTHVMHTDDWHDEWTDHWQPVYGYPWRDVTPEDYDDAMRGVDVAIVFGMRATAAGVSTPHETVARFCEATRTPTVGFMALDPTDADVLAEMRYGVDLGLRGIKLYPVLAGFDPSEPRFDPFYAEAARLGLVILWHVGATPSPVGHLRFTLPLLIDEVARRHPDLRQIMAHMGHPWQRETITVIRKNRNVFTDISGLWARPFDGYSALVRAQEWEVVDKLLFGSDFPLWRPADAIAGLRKVAAIRAGDLPHVQADTIDRILDQDALGLLGLRP
jgi:predicted TIM-barrel fold metal-dependent hydrolase